MTIVMVENGQVLGTIENIEQQDLSSPAVRESLVDAIENFTALDVEFTSIPMTVN